MKKNILVLLVLVYCQLFGQDVQKFNSEEGKFTATFISQPKKQIQTIKRDTDVLDMHMYINEINDMCYMVSYVDYPQNLLQRTTVEEFLNSSRDGAVSNVKGKLIEEKVIDYGGFPGREYKVELPVEGGILRMQTYLVRSRYYQVIVISPITRQYDNSVMNFINSFSIHESAKKNEIESYFDMLNYTYDVDENKQYYLTLRFEDSRTQLVYITMVVSEYDSKEYYDVWSPVGKNVNKFSEDVSNDLLIENGNFDMGSYQLLPIEEGYLLVYAIKIPFGVNVEVFQSILNDVAARADVKEESLYSVDVY